MKHLAHVYILYFFIVVSCTANTITPIPEVLSTLTNESSQVLFDDFSYSTPNEMTANGWTLRSSSGWPGVSGATFRPENVSFVNYPDQAGNRLLRMTSSTDGTSENT